MSRLNSALIAARQMLREDALRENEKKDEASQMTYNDILAAAVALDKRRNPPLLTTKECIGVAVMRGKKHLPALSSAEIPNVRYNDEAFSREMTVEFFATSRAKQIEGSRHAIAEISLHLGRELNREMAKLLHGHSDICDYLKTTAAPREMTDAVIKRVYTIKENLLDQGYYLPADVIEQCFVKTYQRSILEYFIENKLALPKDIAAFFHPSAFKGLEKMMVVHNSLVSEQRASDSTGTHQNDITPRQIQLRTLLGDLRRELEALFNNIEAEKQRASRSAGFFDTTRPIRTESTHGKLESLISAQAKR